MKRLVLFENVLDQLIDEKIKVHQRFICTSALKDVHGCLGYMFISFQ